MKQVGTPFESVSYGLKMTAFFSSMTFGLACQAYNEGDIYAGLSSVACLGITGLAAYNTLALELAGNYSDSIASCDGLS